MGEVDQPIRRAEFEELKAAVEVNSKLTAEVHQILTDFRAFRKIVKATIKWVTAISAAVTAVGVAWNTYSPLK